MCFHRLGEAILIGFLNEENTPTAWLDGKSLFVGQRLLGQAVIVLDCAV